MLPRPTRRQFVLSAAATAAGLGVFTLARSRGAVPVTGAADPRLAPFDRLMTAVVRGVPVPGAALAVTRHGRLVYARGFGHADARRRVPVEPDALFRTASVSKPVTAVAVLRLVDAGQVRLDDPVLKYVRSVPHLTPGSTFDSRWHTVTVRHCLHHTGGWDRDLSPDPSGIPWDIAESLGISPPLSINDVVRYALGRPLDFDPGTRHAYSNLGYLLLGRVIETASGTSYEDYVRREVLAPLGANGMRLGRALPENRFPGEVHYHDTRKRVGRCLYPPRVGEVVPLPDGADNFEVYEAHGGWVASAIDLVRFARGFDDPERCPVLSAKAVETMWQRPPGDAGEDRYYACGWRVRPAGAGGRPNTWHAGTVWGASALLVRRGDGITWAALFNTDSHPNGTKLPELVDGYLHAAADEVTAWPDGA
jgi:N-acyl-D-amino-acid deacylase